MPYTAAQRRLFHAAASDPSIASAHGMSTRKARDMAKEADSYAKEGKEKPAKPKPKAKRAKAKKAKK